jgi:hypothetical protein
MNELQEFEAWWDQDCDTSENPYSQHSMMYWAWEAWKAGRAAEREACAVVAFNAKTYLEAAAAIRVRGQE